MQFLLWQVLSILPLGTLAWFMVVCAVAGTAFSFSAVVTAFLMPLCVMSLLLVVPAALTLLALRAARGRLATYCSIPGFIGAGGATFTVGCYTIANASGMALPLALLWYALGLACAVPFAYATVAQVAVYLTIRQPSRRSASMVQLDAGDNWSTPASATFESRERPG
jgi:hypothetical protein